MQNEESRIAEQIGHFLKIQYPKIIYRFDIADLKLTMPQAMRNKKLQMKHRGFPDLAILKPSKGYHGLYIELKKDKSEVFLKDGITLKKRINKKTGKCHNQEQFEMIQRLNTEGYLALYGFGFGDTQTKIREYLSI